MGVTTDHSDVKIKFFPRDQVLHGKSSFTVIVDDPAGLTYDYRVRLFYNSLDVTDKFLRQSQRTILDSHRIQFDVKNLRILPLRENKIYFGYMRTVQSRPVIARYEPPHCSAFRVQDLASTHEFEISGRIKSLIDRSARDGNINPNFLAGLIAQESGFDSKAVSWAKAIGLTQISPVGEKEVSKAFDQWPRYPDITRMPFPVLKYRVMGGKINGKNEWRLDPELSIKGGVAYIQFLSNYWNREENFEILRHTDDAESVLSNVILASYNSGPARVKYAFQRFGSKWMEAPELYEARLYTTHVTSYCDYFSQGEE
jgi:soluble lytic murein transglycosylase-like protein